MTYNRWVAIEMKIQRRNIVKTLLVSFSQEGMRAKLLDVVVDVGAVNPKVFLNNRELQ